MKKISIISICFVMVLIVSSTCWAFSLGVKGGLHMPIGDYGDIADTGFTVGGQASTAINNNISAGLSVSYDWADLSDMHGDVSMIEILPYVDFNLSPQEETNFFLRGGLGLNIWEVDVSGAGNDDGNDMMIALGGGVELMQNFEFVVLYNRVFMSDDDVEYVNFTVGYNF